MTEGRPISPIPDVPDEVDRPRIGVDEWVASHEGRVERAAPLQEAIRRIPNPALFAGFVVVCALIPVMTSNGYVIRVGFDTLLYMLLALGLNVVVGFAGLLDLGYVAFYGIGAYSYAMLASPKFGVHLPTLAAIPVVVVALVIVGFLVGLPSRRLVGDYLAILTLFFGQLFVTVYTNGNRVSGLGLTRPYDITGGPNGIPNVDPFHLFGHDLISVRGYFWVALGVFAVVMTALHLVDTSRTGRAWKSLREDPLAAELMGMPVNRLKLTAFALGAGVAGLTGTLFASLNTAVFAADFDVPTLITIYAMVILGGAGSLSGVILGAIAVNVSLEVLRTPEHATWVVYILLVATILARLRPLRWLAAVLGGTIAFGFIAHAIAGAIDSSWTAGSVESAGWLGDHITSWVVVPANAGDTGNYAFVLLVVFVLFVTTLKGWAQKLSFIPLIYLTTFVWENRLVQEPSVTRLILLGTLLIVLMNARPQGIAGTSRVEIA